MPADAEEFYYDPVLGENIPQESMAEHQMLVAQQAGVTKKMKQRKLKMPKGSKQLGILAPLSIRPEFDEDFAPLDKELLPIVGPSYQAPTHPRGYPYEAQPWDLAHA